MTGGAFLTKKHKKLMAARRKKKRLAQQQHPDVAAGEEQGAASMLMADDMPINGKTSTLAAAAVSTSATSNWGSDRPAKRQKTSSSSSSQPNSASAVSSTTSSSSITSPARAEAAPPNMDKKDNDNNDQIQLVVIPSNVTAKEAKKLRKEARRKARSEGGLTEEELEKKLMFVNEHGQPIQQQHCEQDEPPSVTAAGSRPPPKTSSSCNKNHPDKKKKEFPRINDILEQERKKAQILARKEALQATEDALPAAIKNRYVALDCEMVGIGVNGKISVLARVSITDWYGTVLLDTYVQVPTRVTDFRTQWSGVTPNKIQAHNNAMAVETCRKKVAQIIQGKILVGHALKNDLDALLLTHPKDDIRDTSKYRYYQRLFNKKWRPRKLRDLVLEHLGLVIQTGNNGHDSVDDAKAAMELFKLSREAWEKDLTSKKHKRQRQK